MLRRASWSGIGAPNPVDAKASQYGSSRRSMLKSPSAIGESRLADGVERGRTMSVPTVTIDSFCAREGLRPSFIKIDVEGAELAVLRGARETIRRGGDVLALFVELHPSIWALAEATRADFESELERQRLKVEPLTSDDPWSVEGMVVRLVPR